MRMAKSLEAILPILSQMMLSEVRQEIGTLQALHYHQIFLDLLFRILLI